MVQTALVLTRSQNLSIHYWVDRFQLGGSSAAHPFPSRSVSRYGGKGDVPKRKTPLLQRRIGKRDALPAKGEPIEVFNGVKNHVRWPYKPIGDVRPKRYSQVFKSGLWEDGEQRWATVSDYLKDKPTDDIVADVQLNVIGGGYVVINRDDSAVSPNNQSGEPHSDVVRDIESFFEAMSGTTRKERRSSATNHLVNNNGGLKGKNGNGIGTRLRNRNV